MNCETVLLSMSATPSTRTALTALPFPKILKFFWNKWSQDVAVDRGGDAREPARRREDYGLLQAVQGLVDALP